MKAVTAKQMKELERIAINDVGIPSLILMENAAAETARLCLLRCTEKELKRPHVLIFAGRGNNGGDGLAAARQLFNKNVSVKVVFVGNENRASEQCKKQLDIIKEMGIYILSLKEGFADDKLMVAKLVNLIKRSDLVLDAVIGTGLKRRLDTLTSEVVYYINRYSPYTVSVDCPTGVNSDNGAVYGEAVKADETVTFHLPKTGLFLEPASEYAGEVIVKDITIPHDLIEHKQIKTNVLFDEEWKMLLPQRSKSGHKGTFGRVLVLAGSKDMSGALCIASLAAYKTGCGLVEAYSEKCTSEVLKCFLPEAISKAVSDIDGKFCEDSFYEIKDMLKLADSVLIGPGIGQGEQVCEFVRLVVKNASCPVVIDADALNAVAKNINVLKEAEAPIIITPHIGEMARLTGLEKKAVSLNMLECAKLVSREYNVVTVLKSSKTVIADSDGTVYINNTGNNALAKGGSGDCLSGVIAALLAQGQKAVLAAALGAYIFGKAGELASEKLGNYSVLASETAGMLSEVLKS